MKTPGINFTQKKTAPKTVAFKGIHADKAVAKLEGLNVSKTIAQDFFQSQVKKMQTDLTKNPPVMGGADAPATKETFERVAASAILSEAKLKPQALIGKISSFAKAQKTVQNYKKSPTI